jgi:hypothetical protein
MSPEENRIARALRQVDETSLAQLSALNRFVYRQLGLHPFVTLLVTSLLLIGTSFGLVAAFAQLSAGLGAVMTIVFMVILWPTFRAIIGLSRLVRRPWTLKSYKPALAYHVVVRDHWKQRAGVLLRCLAVFLLLFSLSATGEVPTFISLVALLSLIVPLELYVRHAEPPMPDEGDLVKKVSSLAPI